MHLPVGELSCPGLVPFPVPIDGSLPLVYNFPETPSLRKAIFLLITSDPFPVVPAASVVQKRYLHRVQAEFGGDAIKHDIVRNTGMGAVPETHLMPFIDQAPFMSAADIGDFRPFIGFFH